MATQQIALFDVTDAPDPRDVYGSIDLLSYDHERGKPRRSGRGRIA